MKGLQSEKAGEPSRVLRREVRVIAKKTNVRETSFTKTHRTRTHDTTHLGNRVWLSSWESRASDQAPIYYQVSSKTLGGKRSGGRSQGVKLLLPAKGPEEPFYSVNMRVSLTCTEELRAPRV